MPSLRHQRPGRSTLRGYQSVSERLVKEFDELPVGHAYFGHAGVLAARARAVTWWERIACPHSAPSSDLSAAFQMAARAAMRVFARVGVDRHEASGAGREGSLIKSPVMATEEHSRREVVPVPRCETQERGRGGAVWVNASFGPRARESG
jgi:hypothetical protein